MASNVVFEWDGMRHGAEVKSADWYWALGIVATAAAIASVLFSNFLLALVIIAGTGTLALQASKTPRIHRFALTDRGLTIDDHEYFYDNMDSFSILEYIDETLPPTLSIKTRLLLAPHLLVPITGHDPLDIYEYLSQHLEDGQHTESLLDRIAGLFHV